MPRRPRSFHIIFILLGILIALHMFMPGSESINPNTPEGQQVIEKRKAEGLPRGVILSLLKGKEIDGIGLMDIIFLGMGLFFLQQYLSGNLSGPRPGEDGEGSEEDPHAQVKQQAEWMWEYLKGDQSQRGRSSGQDQDGNAQEAFHVPPVRKPEPTVNTDIPFDRKEFLDGAQLVYARIRESLSEKDVEDVRTFATPSFMDSIPSIPESTTPVTVLTVQGQLLDVSEKMEEGRRQLSATVSFDALLGDESGQPPTQVEESWSFVRDVDREGATWLLDRISQARSVGSG